MSKRLLTYKNDVRENLIGYEDEKNLIMNPSAQLEWSLIAKFEKKKGIKIENLTDDNEFFVGNRKNSKKEQSLFIRR
ncbi:hypothetical protein [Enterococcus sp. AZ163]|uniref:hypothetical protein n=1 Tax=Enterococcus sp. AZ163 TaxID=2774638 RepID=UPI003D288438